MQPVRGGFDSHSGDQSAQKSGNANQQYERTSKQSVPVNCFLLNQLKAGKIGTTAPNTFTYEWDVIFEVAIITAKYHITDDTQQAKVEGILSDATGFVQVQTAKNKETQDLPEFLQTFTKENSSNKPMYVRAVLRLRKGIVVTLVSFSIVKDFNEITRHGLDVALRFMFRSHGPEVLQLAAPSARSNNATTAKKNQKIVVNSSLDPKSQVLSYFQQLTEVFGNNHQVQSSELIKFFEGRLNQVQIRNYLKDLLNDDKIMNISQTDYYFLVN